MILHCPDFLAATRSPQAGTRSSRDMVDSLLDQLSSSEAPRPPDLVMVTGNLAERATPAEYEMAHQTLSTLRDALAIDHRRIVLVPGSSDVNRLKCHAYFLQCAADEEQPTPPYWEKWQPFATMVRRFHGMELPRDQPWTLTEHPDLGVVVAGFNSTMAQTHLPGDEYGHLGAEQIDWFSDHLSAPARRDWLRVGVLHHRPDGAAGTSGRLADADRFVDALGPHLDLVVHGQPDEPALALLRPVGVPVLGGGSGGWQLVEVHPGHLRVHTLPDGPCPAGSTGPVPLPYPPPRRAVPLPRHPDPPAALRRLADQVAEVCRLRHPAADVTLVRQPDSTRVAYLRVSPDSTRGDRGPAEQHPIGVCAAVPTHDDVGWFVEVLARFRTGSAGRTASLVHVGAATDPRLREWARGRGVALVTFADFQLGPDLDRFTERQDAVLDSDPVYPSAAYVPQRYTEFLPGARAPSEAPPSTDLLAWLRDWVDAPRGRLVVVLGTFGHGKTFLLRELARRMRDDGSRTVPVLIDLRGFEKAYSLDELVAVQLSRHGQRQIDLDAFRYLRREGRVALLFDGFDELATRVSYDRATNHLDTIVQAAEDRAKVIVTSRDQHFLTDADVLSALGAQLGADRRVVRLADFDDHQILTFLTHQLRDPVRARHRLELLRDVKDLLGLSRNPRMLGFITELGEESLHVGTDAGNPITAAGLYRRVLERWLAYETRRLGRLGPLAPSEADLWEAVTHLALRLWDSPDDSLSLDDLGAAAATLSQLTATAVGETAALEPQESAHLLGSSTLLVRYGERRFTFVHHSVREWLIANHLAGQLTAGGGAAPGLIGRSMSPLMIDFLVGLAGHDAMRDWAEQTLAGRSTARGVGRNAVEVLRHLRVATSSPLHMPGFDLRGEDFSARFLAGADLGGADLTGARLVGTNLTGANLTEANLTGARLDRATLRDADLTEADLTGARLLGTDLTGAVLTNVRLRRTALVAATGADGEALRGVDTLGAALPDDTAAEPQIASCAVVHAVAVAFGVRLLAGGGQDGAIRVWDAGNGMPLRMLAGHTGTVRAVAYPPDGRHLASAGDDETIRIWDTTTGHTLHTLTGHTGRIRTVAYSPDGRHLASAGDDETIRIWDTTTGHAPHTLTGHTGRVRTVAYSPHGGHLASAGDDETIRIWDTTTGHTLHTLTGHTGTVHAVGYAPSGDRLASASDDRRIHVWDVTTRAIVHTMTGHTGWIRALAFSPEGRRLVSAGDDGTIRVWDGGTGQALHTLTGHGGSVHAIAYYPDGRHLASAGDDETVRVWDTAEGRLSRTVRGGGGDSRALCFSPREGDPWMAVGSGDGAVRIWSPVVGDQPRVLSEPGGPDTAVTALAVSGNGRYLACAGHDGGIRVWDPTTAELERTLTGHIGAVRAIAFEPGGCHLASAGVDGTIRMWDVSGHGAVRALAGRYGGVTAIAFSPGGHYLASAGTDGTVRVWHLGTGRRQVLPGHANTVRALGFSPDGRHLASADEDGTIRIRGLDAGARPRVLAGHEGAVTAIAFSPDGYHLASAGADGAIRIWATATGQLAHTITGHAGWICSLAYTPDGRHLASAGGDRAVRFWDTTRAGPHAVLVPLAAGGSAVLLDDQRYVLTGQPHGEYWYAIGMCRFEPGELDPYVPALRPVPSGGRVW
ncbi:pentapeptide repeat-containing protein [Micromonospora inyonensis]|uniref:WD40 repeat n=1 Tax=Micromonospora inyonensis TaxID=47866 RepID=A0A1C6S8R8_9ACTN|nr:pentapeptide repeat-containing protein [Micromonospora inyonensis]SCL25849.1 WD40 repeat [Micromonospora inyonensis]